MISVVMIWLFLPRLSLLEVGKYRARHEPPVDAAEESEDGEDDADDGDDQGAGAQVARALLVPQGPHDPRGGPDGEEGKCQTRH